VSAIRKKTWKGELDTDRRKLDVKEFGALNAKQVLRGKKERAGKRRRRRITKKGGRNEQCYKGGISKGR